MPLFSRGFQFEGRRGAGLVQSEFVSAAQQETIVNVSSSLQNSNTTLYTVEDDKILWIVGAWVSCAPTSSFNTTDSASINITTGGNIVEAVCANNQSAGTQTNSLPGNSVSQMFPMPLKVTAGEVVRLEIANSSMRASGGFNGWLEDA